VTLSISSFIERWQQSAAAERANFQLFLSELCDFLDVPRPDPTRPEDHLNTYVFEKPVTFYNLDDTTSQGRIDLYRRGYFVLEAKQGSNPPELRRAGEDLDAQGLTEFLWDVLYWTWGCLLFAAALGDWAWSLWVSCSLADGIEHG